jgi:tRNA threonylcarbamoyl adenosine modification protein YeaZ
MENQDKSGNMGNEPLILAAETSSRVGSVALALGDTLIEESTFSSPMQHSAEIVPAIGDLLARHGRSPREIDQVHIAIGPGSFTGLRIAVTLAKTMHLAHGVQIVTVGSLDVVVANLSDRIGGPEGPLGPQGVAVPNRVAALFDAKRGQFYVGVYELLAPGAVASQEIAGETPGYRIPAMGDAVWHRIRADSLMTAEEIIGGFSPDGPLGVLGDGLLYHREQFTRENVVILPQRCWSPRAAAVHHLGRQKARAERFADPLTLTPFYLRGPQVTLRVRP